MRDNEVHAVLTFLCACTVIIIVGVLAILDGLGVF